MQDLTPSSSQAVAIGITQLYQAVLGVVAGTEEIARGRIIALDQVIEQIGMMPRTKQKFIPEMLEALIKQQQAS